jgi:hypothetical protein
MNNSASPEAQLAFLQAHQCAEGQGCLFGKPLAAEPMAPASGHCRSYRAPGSPVTRHTGFTVSAIIKSGIFFWAGSQLLSTVVRHDACDFSDRR